MLVIIQDTWCEYDDEELLEFIKLKNISFQQISGKDILKLTTLPDMLFADTDIIHKLIPVVIQTYPQEFNSLYKRKIVKIIFKGSNYHKKPFFIKPAIEHKKFNALVVNDKYDETYINDYINDLVYICESVKYINEYRLFIANNSIRGMVESTNYVLGTKNTNHKVPDRFLNTILKLNPYPFCVIDIGEIDEGKWSIVEVNPPFSLSSYDWDIQEYYKYSVDAWKYLKNKINFIVYEKCLIMHIA